MNFRTVYGRRSRTWPSLAGAKTALFFVIFSQGEAETSSATAEDRQKERAGDQAFEGRIASPITARRNPHGVYKPTRNYPLGQSLFTAVRRPWIISGPRRWSVGAFVPRSRGCWSSGSHDIASVSCFYLPASSPARYPYPTPVPREAPTPDAHVPPPHGEGHSLVLSPTGFFESLGVWKSLYGRYRIAGFCPANRHVRQHHTES